MGGEALSSPNATLREYARCANRYLEHTRHNFAYYWPWMEKFWPRILYIGLTCRIDSELKPMLSAVEVPENVTRVLKVGSTQSNPKKLKHLESLSSLARANLEELLQEDYKIIRKLFEIGHTPALDLKEACRI